MTKTLLFDLDDTLIGNPMDSFVPAYSRALAKKLAPERQETLIGELLRATRSMMGNLDSTRTLEQVFDNYFFPALNITRQEVQSSIDEFYIQDFPELEKVTEYRADAVQLVDQAMERGWDIAIATNPLFPITAILQRLEWAGMGIHQYPWIIVPSYETFHFAKPNPEYFAELLGQIGWPEEPVVMIGNDKENDIDSARNFGLATYWVDAAEENLNQQDTIRHGQGKLRDLFSWIDRSNLEGLATAIHTNRALLAVLRSTTAAVTSMTRNINSQGWCLKPTVKEWCLTEIICHLRDVEEEVNLPRIESVLSQDNPFITGKNTDVWAEERNYIKQDGPEALNRFINCRLNLIRILENLTDREWELTARHSIFGPIQLSELVRISASHDKLHLNTISRLVNTVLHRENSG